jgi:DnaK suppressor protein
MVSGRIAKDPIYVYEKTGDKKIGRASIMKKPSSSSASASKHKAAVAAKKVATSRGGEISLKVGGSVVPELSRHQLHELRERLTGLKGEIENALSKKADFFNTNNHNESLIKGDDAEVAEKQRQSNAALQEIDIMKNRLALIDRALIKIEGGAYGVCEETEEPIGYERLKVVPWARYCVRVQEMRERKLRDFKVNRLRSEA